MRSVISTIPYLLALAGVLLAAYSTWRAARRPTTSAGFGLMALAGSCVVLLPLGAAMAVPSGDGLRAAALQAIVVAVAALLGGLSLRPDPSAGPGRALAGVGLFLAWLALLGLPPTAGFHAHVLIYRSLLQAGWPGTLAIALAVSAAGLVPAFGALALGCSASLKGGRAFLAIMLMCTLLAGGIYPGFGLRVASFLAGSP